ncbi:hypothetical protein [Enterococcus sp. AZ102]|uniref:hypothetical protein n=1 Tax=Enterococcus sp. AZ102 TaxID=2774865 RepID=UPI003F23530E
MLKQFTLKRIGFGKALKINDVFEYENEKWIIRHIVNIKIDKRLVQVLGKHGWQHDVVVSEVVAQNTNSFNIQNLKSYEIELSFSHRSDFFKGIGIGGIVKNEESGHLYVVKTIESIEYKLVDVHVDFTASNIVELPIKEVKRLSNKQKLNELGWKVIW